MMIINGRSLGCVNCRQDSLVNTLLLNYRNLDGTLHVNVNVDAVLLIVRLLNLSDGIFVMALCVHLCSLVGQVCWYQLFCSLSLIVST